MKIIFYKYQGTGNDFIIIPELHKIVEDLSAETIRRLCHRHFGIGADGLMDVYDFSPEGSFSVRYYNSDGYKAEMCGNGARCAARFAANYAGNTALWRFKVWEDWYAAIVKSDAVRVNWEKAPILLELPADLEADGHLKPVAFWNSGVPHLIIVVKNIEKTDVAGEGKFWRNHPYFLPAGTNVNFIEIQDSGEVRIRTFERGVEGETLSCGTGALAVAAEIISQNPGKNKVTLLAAGGRLKAGREKEGTWWLEGPAELVFKGEMDL
ncbi:MAG: diaminopimelate epimerase [Calditrichia bacterium]